MKFRKKPVEFEAVQITQAMQEGSEKLPPGVSREQRHQPYPDIGTLRLYVTTTHGQETYLLVGDWIVAEPNGNGFYPVAADVMPLIADPVL